MARRSGDCWDEDETLVCGGRRVVVSLCEACGGLVRGVVMVGPGEEGA